MHSTSSIEVPLEQIREQHLKPSIHVKYRTSQIKFFFGCIAFVHVPKENQKKFDSKTLKCMFLGFDSESKAYCLFDQTRQKVVISRDVVFDETKVGPQHLSHCKPPSEVQIPFSKTHELNSNPTETQMIESIEAPELDPVTGYNLH